MPRDSNRSPHDAMYMELTPHTVVFAGSGPATNRWQQQNTPTDVRGVRWVNEQLAALRVRPEDAMQLDMNFRDANPGDVHHGGRANLKGETTSPTNPTYGRDISQGPGQSNRRPGGAARSIGDALTDIDDRAERADASYERRYDQLVTVLTQWRLDGVLINSDAEYLEDGTQGTNDLLVNVAVAGNAQVRNVNSTVFSGGSMGVAGGVAPAVRSLSQDFDPLPEVGDEFYVALHLTPRGISGGKATGMVFEYRLWSTRRWNKLAARFASRAGRKGDRLRAQRASALEDVPPGPHEPGRAARRATMRADELLESQLFATIVGAWRVGTIIDSRAAVEGTADPYYALAGRGRRCAAVRAVIGIRWEGLVALRQRHGTSCLEGDPTNSGESVIIKALDPRNLKCYPIDIGEVFATTSAFTEWTDVLGEGVFEFSDLFDVPSKDVTTKDERERRLDILVRGSLELQLSAVQQFVEDKLASAPRLNAEPPSTLAKDAIDSFVEQLTQARSDLTKLIDAFASDKKKYESRYSAFVENSSEVYLFLVDPSDCAEDGHANFTGVKRSLSDWKEQVDNTQTSFGAIQSKVRLAEQGLKEAYVKAATKARVEAEKEAEKARLEAEKARLEAEKARLEAEETARLEAETARLEEEKARLEEAKARLEEAERARLEEAETMRSARRKAFDVNSAPGASGPSRQTIIMPAQVVPSTEASLRSMAPPTAVASSPSTNKTASTASAMATTARKTLSEFMAGTGLIGDVMGSQRQAAVEADFDDDMFEEQESRVATPSQRGSREATPQRRVPSKATKAIRGKRPAKGD